MKYSFVCLFFFSCSLTLLLHGLNEVWEWCFSSCVHFNKCKCTFTRSALTHRPQWTCMRFSFQFSNNFVVFDVFVARNRMTINHTKHIHHISHIVTSAAEHSIEPTKRLCVCLSCLELRARHLRCAENPFSSSATEPLTSYRHLFISHSSFCAQSLSPAKSIRSRISYARIHHVSLWAQKCERAALECADHFQRMNTKERYNEYAGVIAEHRYHLILALLSLFFCTVKCGTERWRKGRSIWQAVVHTVRMDSAHICIQANYLHY